MKRGDLYGPRGTGAVVEVCAVGRDQVAFRHPDRDDVRTLHLDAFNRLFIGITPELLAFRSARASARFWVGEPLPCFVAPLGADFGVPLFPVESVERMIAAGVPGVSMTVDAGRDVLIVLSEDDQEPEEYFPQFVVIDKRLVKAFAVGGGFWRWVVEAEPVAGGVM